MLLVNDCKCTYRQLLIRSRGWNAYTCTCHQRANLPPTRAIWAIYVWCRRTDELVDGPNALSH